MHTAALYLSAQPRYVFRPPLLGRASVQTLIRLYLALLLFGLFMMPAFGAAAPFRPADDSVVLEKLPLPGDAEARELRRLRRELGADPDNLQLALSLARRYVSLGRSEADPRYYGYAEAALAPWWSLESPPVEVLVVRAVLRQARHDFDAALADLDKVLDLRPRDPQALLTRAFVLQVQGRYAEAQASCRRLPTAVGSLVISTCISRMESLSGASDRAYARLSRAVAEAKNADGRLRLWALTNLAEIAIWAGKLDLAERHFKDALALGQKDAYLLGAYADLLIDQERYEEVQALLAGETRVDALLLRLAIAAQGLGDPEAEAHTTALEDRFAASRLRGDARHRREEARFTLRVLDEPQRALELAQQNWRRQREPQDARLVLEAALAAQTPDAARPVLDWLAETGLVTADLGSLVQRLERENG